MIGFINGFLNVIKTSKDLQRLERNMIYQWIQSKKYRQLKKKMRAVQKPDLNIKLQKIVVVVVAVVSYSWSY